MINFKSNLKWAIMFLLLTLKQLRKTDVIKMLSKEETNA